MIRSILAGIAGFVVAILVIMGVQMVSYFLYGPPSGVEKDPAAMEAYIRSLPLGAFLIVLLSYFLGTFCGVVVAVFIARRAPVVFAVIFCVVFMLANVMNLLTMPGHPLWFWVVSFAVYPFAAAAGALVAWPRAPLQPA